MSNSSAACFGFCLMLSVWVYLAWLQSKPRLCLARLFFLAGLLSFSSPLREYALHPDPWRIAGWAALVWMALSWPALHFEVRFRRMKQDPGRNIAVALATSFYGLHMALYYL